MYKCYQNYKIYYSVIIKDKIKEIINYIYLLIKAENLFKILNVYLLKYIFYIIKQRKYDNKLLYSFVPLLGYYS